MRKGWNTWVREKPEWFNDFWKGRVPLEWRPESDGMKTLLTTQNEHGGLATHQDRHGRRRNSSTVAELVEHVGEAGLEQVERRRKSSVAIALGGDQGGEWAKDDDGGETREGSRVHPVA